MCLFDIGMIKCNLSKSQGGKSPVFTLMLLIAYQLTRLLICPRFHKKNIFVTLNFLRTITLTSCMITNYVQNAVSLPIKLQKIKLITCTIIYKEK